MSSPEICLQVTRKVTNRRATPSPLQPHFQNTTAPPHRSAPSPLPAAVEVAAYRIVLEALTNVVRHAKASQCQVFLEHTTDHLIITITDDGRGLPPETQPGVGLTSMRERTEELGGQFTITRLPTGGTNVTTILPLLSTQIGSISEIEPI